MGNYTYMRDKFMPPGTQHTVQELWELSDSEFVTRAKELETSGLAVIKASINVDALIGESGTEVLSDMLSQYVTAKFFEQLVNHDYESEVDSLLTSFWDTVKTIKEAQQESNVNPEEDSNKTVYPMIGVFN